MKRQPTLFERGIHERITCELQHCREHGHFHPCRLEDCPKPRESRISGYCRNHNRRWRQWGDPLGGREYRRSRGYCTWPGCSKKHRRIGYCGNHSAIVYRMRRAEPEQCTFVRTEPIARFIEQLAFRYSYDDIAERAGVSRASLELWRAQRHPRIHFDNADRLVTAFNGDPTLLEVA